MKNMSALSIEVGDISGTYNIFEHGGRRSDESYVPAEGLEGAAFQSGFPAAEMTQDEMKAFSDIATGAVEARKVYFYLRNRALQLWLENPKKELVFDDYNAKLERPYDSVVSLAYRVHAFLSRFGYINFGVFTRVSQRAVRPRPVKVLVLGAGISGLAGASQLQQFGFEVVVLEGRDRVGGRIATFRKNNYIADLGAMVITGLGGNPLAILARQLNTELLKIRRKCPLYEAATGNPVSKLRDDSVEKEFNKLLEACAFLAHALDIDRIGRKKLSLGESMEWLIMLQEKRVKEDQIRYWEEFNKLQSKKIDVMKKMYEHQENADLLKKKVEKDLKVLNKKQKDRGDKVRVTRPSSMIRPEDLPLIADIKLNQQARMKALREWKRLQMKKQVLETRLERLETNPPPDVYLSPNDRKILDWHFANLEFANACPLSELSLKHWDQDDDFEFIGSHLSVINGYSSIPVALAEGLDIRMKQIVNEVRYDQHGVKVTTMKGEEFEGDAILCTLPLGILKAAVRRGNGEKGNEGGMRGLDPIFRPPLPMWKQEAIERLGFGVLNKVVLCFQRVFWDPSVHLFGHVGTTTESRGELFLFFYLYKAPVLVALVAGEAAGVMESVSDEIIIGRCLKVLKSIFGPDVVPHPTDTVVTRWKSDPLSKGSYSYVGIGASGDDYDQMAAPVAPPDSDGDSKCSRLFFAGEHTIRNYPATVHGALMSGLREARIIADQFTGSPYVAVAKK
ncbi:unnamed protein product [Notodromas monacha]|uniref:SWIRM domain-containing protein n=1 Tax=Notodromas monacha TaxID=399045 RepID=A0A7R9BLU3_9CRUS|nr:unnamed protein product [Notodromas monacha]CAG0916513.1 unnamed protein product [Notodromas monacha]